MFYLSEIFVMNNSVSQTSAIEILKRDFIEGKKRLSKLEEMSLQISDSEIVRRKR